MQMSEKPIVGRVKLPDGSWRNHGLNAAAEWLGKSPATLTRIIENPDDNEHSQDLNNLVKTEFPEFFRDE